MDLRFSTLMWYHVHFLWEKWNTKRGENQKNTVGKISRFLPLNIHIFRPTDRVRINILNLCENEDSFLKSHHKVKNASSSISKWCISNDRHRRTIDVNFFCLCIRLRQVCLFSEQTGVFLSETDSERFLDSDESVCCNMLQRLLKILIPRKKVSGRSWWNTRKKIHGGTKEHTSEGIMTTVQTCRIKFESLSICQYKLSNIWIDRKVISRLTKFY